jgi:hypothetical protein
VSVGVDYVWLLNTQGVPYKYEIGGFQNLSVFNPASLTGIDDAKYYANSVIVKENPFRESLNVEISSNGNDEVVLRLFGMDGKLYVSEKAALQAGINTISLNNVSRLNKDIYVLSVSGKTQNAKIKVIKK